MSRVRRSRWSYLKHGARLKGACARSSAACTSARRASRRSASGLSEAFVLAHISRFFGRRAALQDGIAMRKAAEATDDRGVLFCGLQSALKELTKRRRRLAQQAPVSG